MGDPWDQAGYRCRLEWGRRGARAAAERGDLLVVVDVLRFSSAVVTAVAHGAVIYPCAWEDDPAALAARVQAEVAVQRRDVPASGRFSLSPPTFEAATPGTRVVLASPNGATCSRYAAACPQLLIGALTNARAVAEAVSQVLAETEVNATILACGERWKTPSEDGELRFAIEDYLGAGAILAQLATAYSRSPEARVCEGAFRQVGGEVGHVLAESGSGRELRAMGFAQDVEHAAQLDRYDVVPVMQAEPLLAEEGDAPIRSALFGSPGSPAAS